MRPVTILQARMASRRLPGKALALIGDRSILRRCIDRLSLASPIPVVVATTCSAEDDALEAEARRAGVLVVRGATDDVLDRFLLVARITQATHIVRATADNPAVDIDGPERALSLLVSTGADHAIECGLPYGAAVEAVTVAALERAASLTSDPFDREHVTPFIRKNYRFGAVQTPAPRELRRPDVRVTVDTPGDLDYMRRVMQWLGDIPAEPTLGDIILAADALADAKVA